MNWLKIIVKNLYLLLRSFRLYLELMLWLFLGTVSLVNINKLVVSLLNEEEDTGKLETSVNSVPKKTARRSPKSNCKINHGLIMVSSPSHYYNHASQFLRLHSGFTSVDTQTCLTKVWCHCRLLVYVFVLISNPVPSDHCQRKSYHLQLCFVSVTWAMATD